MRPGLTFAAVALALGLATPAAAEGVIGMDAVKAGLDTGTIVLVDVREPDEFTSGHVPGAINLPLSSFSPSALPKSTDKTVVVMCRSGRRAGQVQAITAATGRRDLVNYSGSMNEWSAKGGPIVTGR